MIFLQIETFNNELQARGDDTVWLDSGNLFEKSKNHGLRCSFSGCYQIREGEEVETALLEFTPGRSCYIGNAHYWMWWWGHTTQYKMPGQQNWMKSGRDKHSFDWQRNFTIWASYSGTSLIHTIWDQRVSGIQKCRIQRHPLCLISGKKPSWKWT